MTVLVAPPSHASSFAASSLSSIGSSAPQYALDLEAFREEVRRILTEDVNITLDEDLDTVAEEAADDADLSGVTWDVAEGPIRFTTLVFDGHRVDVYRFPRNKQQEFLKFLGEWTGGGVHGAAVTADSRYIYLYLAFPSE